MKVYYLSRLQEHVFSLFSREPGYRLEGVVGAGQEESVPATAEECAKLCLYSKRRQGDCCRSFSHRPARPGKEDRCVLGTSFTNRMDSLVEKRSWTYYTLNTTDDSRSVRRC